MPSQVDNDVIIYVNYYVNIEAIFAYNILRINDCLHKRPASVKDRNIFWHVK